MLAPLAAGTGHSLTALGCAHLLLAWCARVASLAVPDDADVHIVDVMHGGGDNHHHHHSSLSSSFIIIHHHSSSLSSSFIIIHHHSSSSFIVIVIMMTM
jgi:hypothetical protein